MGFKNGTGACASAVGAIAAWLAFGCLSAHAAGVATPNSANSPLYRIPGEGAAQARSELIEDYGSFRVVRMAADAASKSAALALPGTLHLRQHVFDPLLTDPRVEIADPRGRFDGLDDAGGDFIVQFLAPIRAEWLQALRDAGLSPIQYLPHQAYLVRGSADAARALGAHPRVRYVGPWQPAFRVAPALAWALGAADPAVPAYGRDAPARYELAISRQAPRALISATLAAKGGVLRDAMTAPTGQFELLRVDLPPTALADIARLPGVIALDPYFPPLPEDERSAQIVAGNFASPTELDPPGYDPQAQFGVNGAGVTVAVSDDGLGIPGDGGYYLSFGNTINGPLRGASTGADGHGHLSGTIIAGSTPLPDPDALGYSYGLGVAPGASLINIPFLRTGYTGNDTLAADDSVGSFGVNGVRASITNNSWGAGGNGNHYDAFAALYDSLVRDASSGASIDPLLIVFSAGNEGSLGLTRPKMAKNVISVAASENLRPEFANVVGFGAADNLEDVPAYSSRGPGADGRIKPDITAPGEAIAGGRSGASWLAGNLDLYHRWASGTSHAAPQISAAAALFTQAWKLSHAGVRPSPAMIKAALLNGAVDMFGNGASAPIPNGAEGWGRVNLRNLLNTGVAQVQVDQSERLEEVGATYVFSGRVADSTRELRIALVWTDAPGLTDPALVNDLDLSVQIGATHYRGNVFAAGLSTTGGTADSVNNVEKLLLPAGVPTNTPLTISVRASALNGDGVPGNAAPLDQDFALSCFNCEPVPAFSLALPLQIASLCAGEPLSRTVSLTPVLGYNAPVNLSLIGLPPAGPASFTPNPVVALPGSSLLAIDTAALDSGPQVLTVAAVSGALQRQLSFPIFVATAVAAPPELTSPTPMQTGIATTPVFQWTPVAQAFDYAIEVSTAANFETLVASGQTRATAWAPASPLMPDTLYYWRVSARNHCARSGAEVFNDGFEAPLPGPSVSPSGVGSFTTRPNPPATGHGP